MENAHATHLLRCRGHPQKLDAGGTPAERDVGERDACPAAPLVPGRGRQREHGVAVGRQTADELRPVQAGASVCRDDAEVRQRRQLAEQRRPVADHVHRSLHGPGDRHHQTAVEQRRDGLARRCER